MFKNPPRRRWVGGLADTRRPGGRRAAFAHRSGGPQAVACIAAGGSINCRGWRSRLGGTNPGSDPGRKDPLHEHPAAPRTPERLPSETGASSH